MPTTQLAKLTQPQRDRLAFIELRVRFLGEVRRQDLAARFSVRSAAATRDLALYKDLAPANISYDTKVKRYLPTNSFRPLFEFAPERVLSWLTQSFGDGEPSDIKAWLPSDVPARLALPNLDILSYVTRAIHQEVPLAIKYHSLTNGITEREIIPFALIDNGLNWHVRAFDRKTEGFRDFVITRIQSPDLLHQSEVLPHERRDQDIQWTRIVELELIPHPTQPRPEVTELDYGMLDGTLKVKLRAATAGYILRHWSIDCSPDHSLKDPECRLWLKDHLAIYGVKSAVLAPGYSTSNQRLTTDWD